MRVRANIRQLQGYRPLGNNQLSLHLSFKRWTTDPQSRDSLRSPLCLQRAFGSPGEVAASPKSTQPPSSIYSPFAQFEGTNPLPIPNLRVPESQACDEMRELRAISGKLQYREWEAPSSNYSSSALFWGTLHLLCRSSPLQEGSFPIKEVPFPQLSGRDPDTHLSIATK